MNKDRKKHLIGVQLCACGAGHLLKCGGVCRETHFNKGTGKVSCIALYTINTFYDKEGRTDSGNTMAKRNRSIK